jgi:hypothetical protein
MNDCPFVLRGVALLVAVTIGATGCSINPYVEPQLERPGLERDANSDPVYGPGQTIETTPVTVTQVREYARSLQDAYRKAAAGQSQSQTVLDLTTVALAASAIGLAATGGRPETAGLLGLSAGAINLLGNRLLVATRKRIYFQGALALECVIGAAVAHPLANARVQSAAVEIELFAARTDELEVVLDAFESAVGVYREEVERGDIAPSRRSRARRELGSAQGVIEDTRRVLTRARLIQATATALIARIDPLAQILLSKVEQIRLQVDAEVAKSEPDLLTYNDALKALLGSVPSAFLPAEQAQALIGGAQVPELEFSERFSDPQVDQLWLRLQQLRDDVQAAGRTLDAAIAVLAQTPIRYPADLFTHCSLNRPIGAGALRLGRQAIEISRGAAAQLEVGISGGRAPYGAMIAGDQPEGIEVSQEPTRGGATLSVAMSASFTAQAASPVMIQVEDAQGNSRILAIDIAGATMRPTQVRGATTPSAEVALVQRHLISLLGENAVGPNKADGIWGQDTKEAVVRFLSDPNTFEDLKVTPEFLTEFEGIDAPPDFSQKSPEQLIAYMKALI